MKAQRDCSTILRLVLLTSWQLISFATCWEYTDEIVAESFDGNYRFVVKPPAFKHSQSYAQYQSGDFLYLTAVEGAESAGSAVLVGTLSRRDSQNFTPIWSRPLEQQIIPRRVFVLSNGTNAVAGLEGQKMVLASNVTFYAFYSLKGQSITNMFLSNNSSNKWSLDGAKLILERNSVQNISISIK